MEQVYEDVLEDRLPQVEGNCLSAGATKIVKERQGNGLWTVTCTYPDKPSPDNN